MEKTQRACVYLYTVESERVELGYYAILIAAAHPKRSATITGGLSIAYMRRGGHESYRLVAIYIHASFFIEGM